MYFSFDRILSDESQILCTPSFPKLFEPLFIRKILPPYNSLKEP